MNKKITLFGAFIFLCVNNLFSNVAFADWTLDAANSNLSYGTIKNDAIGENNTFKTISGTISDNGHVNIDIALASVDTQLELRDERMRDIVFKVAENVNAKLTGDMDLQQFATLAIGSNSVIETSIMLELVGEKVEIDATLVVIRLAENKVMVIPHNVIFIDVDDFELAPAIETLRGLAGLDTIATVVPMSFYLTFTK
ncbi:MAG: YceI family protein [Proteobacteria bacterium]|jgi:hypothetical protein|nr:YceI family protein [Pseudomonadota bacterium]